MLVVFLQESVNETQIFTVRSQLCTELTLTDILGGFSPDCAS